MISIDAKKMKQLGLGLLGSAFAATLAISSSCGGADTSGGAGDDDDDASSDEDDSEDSSSADDDDDDSQGSDESEDSTELETSSADDEDDDATDSSGDDDDDDDSSESSGDDDDDDDDETGDDSSGEDSGDGEGNPACSIEISEISLFQATQVPLAKDGKPASGYAKPIANRPGIVRVSVKSLAGDGDVTATLTIKTDGKEHVITETKSLSEDSSDDDLDSTFNLEFAADEIGKDSTFSVALTQESECDKPGAWRYPDSGESDLGVQESGEVTVVVMPIVTSNGRMPAISDALLKRFAEDADAVYPSNGFKVTQGDVQNWNDIDIPETIMSQSDADKLTSEYLRMLDKLCALRDSEAGDNVHYYGLISPNATRPQVLVTGLATNPARENPGAIAASCAVGVSYAGDDEYASDTFYHELGHAFSQSHSPGCDAGLPDEDYPYDDGKIGVWGWDRRSGELKKPTSNSDFMTYCTPYWVSDYTYNKLLEPVQTLAKLAHPTPDRRTQKYRTLFVRQDGSLQWGSSYTSRVRSGAKTFSVRVTDAKGHSRTVDAPSFVIDDIGAKMLRIPDDGQLRSVEFNGKRVQY
jgi:hypothetical protein